MSQGWVYLDQNYASGIARCWAGEAKMAHYGRLFEVLQKVDLIVPASPFHVSELRDTYLHEGFAHLFDTLSQGYRVCDWPEVLRRQKVAVAKGEDPRSISVLEQRRDWEQGSDLSLFVPCLGWEFEGLWHQRRQQAVLRLSELLEISSGDEVLPWVEVMAGMLAFRSLNPARVPRESDLFDMVLTATVCPYASWFGTDRFVREGLQRMGWGKGVYAGRVREVLAMCDVIAAA